MWEPVAPCNDLAQTASVKLEKLGNNCANSYFISIKQLGTDFFVVRETGFSMKTAKLRKKYYSILLNRMSQFYQSMTAS